MTKTPAVTDRRTKYSAAALLTCRLALVAGFTVFATGAAATNQSPSVAGTEPVPDFTGVAADSGTPAPAPATAVPQLDAIPCMNSFIDAPLTASASTDDTCDSDEEQQDDRFSIRFGERIGPDSGILGEFDGIRVDYRLTGNLTVNGIAGYPVLSTQDKFNDSRQVFGVSAATSKLIRSWDLNGYLIERQDGGQINSREVGAALRYLRAKRSLLLFLNYDAANHALGGFTTSGALKLPYRTTISANIDLRNKPIYKRQQRYLEQSMSATEGWTWILPTERIRYLTGDRSEAIMTLAMGLTHTFSDNLELTGSVARLDATSTSPETVDSYSGTTVPSEYFYHLKLSGKNLMFPGDSNLLDVSHHVAEARRTSSASLNTRYVINRRWNVSPRLRTDYRDNPLEKSARWVTSPSVGMEYRWRELYRFKIEAGGQWLTEQDPDADRHQTSYFVNVAYKARF